MSGARTLIAAGLILLGAAIGWRICTAFNDVAEPAKVEAAAPAETQADGSVVLERKPNPRAKPKQPVPSGARAERVGSVTVQPETAGPVTVDWSLLKLTDNTRRMVASSEDGEVIGGVDVPVAVIAEPNLWAAGLSFDPVRQTSGIWVERDYSRIRVGVDINQTRIRVDGPSGIEARIRIGVTF